MTPGYRIDDVTLRDEPDDRADAWRRVGELEAQGPAGDGERVVWLRMLGELGAAEELGWRTLAGAGGPPDPDSVRSRPSLGVVALAPTLRLAHVLQWQRRFAAADELFGAAIASAERLAATEPAGSQAAVRATAMTAFGYQHLGKSLFDQGRYGEALALFERALAVRQGSDAPADQLASSRQAIAAARRRLG